MKKQGDPMKNNNGEVNIGWHFDNSYTQLPGALFTKQHPVPVRLPKLIVFNDSLAKSLGLNVKALKSDVGVSVLAGNRIPEGTSPLAQAYAGHQFGHFTMLGDGRAILIGEHITPLGERFDIQLKGSGRTPYSRGGDGRATLGPMLREYIISEAMHGLGVPTTRSLAVVTTGESVIRETELSGAILTRLASSHLRVGTFEYVAAWRPVDELKELAHYTIKRHFPYVEESENKYVTLLEEVIKRQAELIAKWQLVGFIHGVMNTDNMTLSGETIDYGPCAFMDQYNPATVFSSIDIEARYAYRNQPGIGEWNLARFAETLLPLLDDDEKKAINLAQQSLRKFEKLYVTFWLNGMRKKLGLFNEEKEDEILIKDLLHLMEQYKEDYTNTFRYLTFDRLDETDLSISEEFIKWYKRWQARLERQPNTKAHSKQLMIEHNPAVIPRNHRVEEAIEAAVERADYSDMERLLDILSKPYAHTEEQEPYTELPPPSNFPYQTFCGT
ncbi:MAG TPA: YdiU family protein [Cerasibacillus sp.]